MQAMTSSLCCLMPLRRLRHCRKSLQLWILPGTKLWPHPVWFVVRCLSGVKGFGIQQIVRRARSNGSGRWISVVNSVALRADASSFGFAWEFGLVLGSEFVLTCFE